MKNNFKEQLHTEAKRIALTLEEKNAMRAVILYAMKNSHDRVRSPYSRYFWSIQRALVPSLIVLFMIGGTSAYAAQRALPGDVLYPLKVNVSEPITGALQFSTQSKIAWHAQVAQTRAEEAEQLASESRLTPEAARELAISFNEHVSAAVSLIGKGTNGDENNQADTVGTVLETHSRILSALGAEASGTPVGRTTTLFAAEVSSSSNSLLRHSPDDSGQSGEIQSTANTKNSSATTLGFTSAPTATSSVSISNSRSLRTVALPTTSTGVASTASTSHFSLPSTTLTAPAKDLTQIRSQATGEISALEAESEKIHASIDSSAADEISRQIATMKKTLSGADVVANTNPGVAEGAYRSTYLTGVSLQTILSAGKSLGGTQVLNVLLKHDSQNDNSAAMGGQD